MLTCRLQEEAFLNRPEIRIPCPDTIKAALVDDWENVTKNLMLRTLPAAEPVTAILGAYYEQEMPKRRAGSADADLLDEVRQGLEEYFNKCLGRILLYKFERMQYAEVRRWYAEPSKPEYEGKGAADIYGAEHLARLIGKLFSMHKRRAFEQSATLMGIAVTMPELVAQTNMDQQSVHRMREEMSKLLIWLAKNGPKYFVGAYENATPEYVEKARGV